MNTIVDYFSDDARVCFSTYNLYTYLMCHVMYVRAVCYRALVNQDALEVRLTKTVRIVVFFLTDCMSKSTDSVYY